MNKLMEALESMTQQVEFLTHAVESHEILVQALRSMLNVADIEGWHVRHAEDIDRARDVLKRTEE